MSTPPIPSRPVKQASEVPAELATSHNSPDSNTQETTIPAIPRRPNRPQRHDSNPNVADNDLDSGSLTSEVGSAPEKPVPVVPSHRPVRRAPTTESATSTTSSVVELTEETVEAPSLARANSTAMSESSIIDAYASNPHDSIPIPDQGLAGSDDDDGDKTPGNTENKVSMKVEEDEPIPGGPDDSSFDDDQETVSQDVEDQRDRNNMVSTSSPAPVTTDHSTDHDNDDLSSTKPVSTSSVVDEPQHQQPIAESTTASLPPKASGNDNDHDDDKSEPVKSVVDKQPLGETKDDKSVDDTPQGSKGMMEKVEEFVADVKHQASEKIDEFKDKVEETKQEKSPTDNTPKPDNDDDKPEKSSPSLTQLDKTTSSEATTTTTATDRSVSPTAVPTIPKRPQRPSVPSRPAKKPSVSSLPSAASPASPSLTASDEPVVKPKAPPPKPKKLSSKIAAFQEMLKNPQGPPPRSTSPTNDEGSSRKLSADKRGFAQNLQGMMGMGVPLPGMAATPEILRKLKSQDEENDGDDDTTSSHKVTGPRRARGPKKRLPKALEEAKNATQSPRYQISTGTLWSVTPVTSASQEPATIEGLHRNETSESIVSDQERDTENFSELKETDTLVNDSDTDILEASTVQSHPTEPEDSVQPQTVVRSGQLDEDNAGVSLRESEQVADDDIEPADAIDESKKEELHLTEDNNVQNEPQVPHRPSTRPSHTESTEGTGMVRQSSDLDAGAPLPHVALGSRSTTEGDSLRGMFRTASDLDPTRGPGDDSFTRTSTYSSEKPDGLVTEGFSRSSTFTADPASQVMATTHEEVGEDDHAAAISPETSSFEEITTAADDDHFVEVDRTDD